jgi:hypothetical protein
MSSQGDFSQALLDADSPIPIGLTTWNGSDPAGRFAVYRNNVFASLIDALADTYPVVQALVGEAFFRATARVFVQSNPPRSRVLAYFGAGFADFVEDFYPARSLPYLADVARLEIARVEAYHAADAKPVDPQRLRTVLSDPKLLMSLRVSLHPSVRVVCSPYAIGSLWAAHLDTLNLATVDILQPESVLVFRSGLDVAMLEISDEQGRFVAALQGGASLIEAADHVSTTDHGFDLTQTLAMLLRQQLLTDLVQGDTPNEHTH